MSIQITSAIVGLFIGAAILYLVRKSHLHTGYSLWWFMTAFCLIFFGCFPQIIDAVGHFLGIQYPPILLIVLGICVLLLKILLMDIERTKQEQKLRRLVQRLAILEEKKDQSYTGAP